MTAAYAYTLVTNHIKYFFFYCCFLNCSWKKYLYLRIKKNNENEKVLRALI